MLKAQGGDLGMEWRIEETFEDVKWIELAQ